MREEVSRRVHEIDGGLVVRHRYVDVQPENQERPRQLLQLFDNAVVTNTRRENLIFPVRERMRPRRRDGEANAFGSAGELTARPEDLFAELRYVLADPRADLDDRLVQLALDLLAERRRTRR